MSGHANKVLVEIPPIGHLRYDKVIQSYKSSNFVNQKLETLSNNIKKYIFSCVINLCNYLAGNLKNEFTSAIGDAGLDLFLVNEFYGDYQYDE